MMAEIIDMERMRKKKRHDVVWQCGCGNQTFFLVKGGTVQCARCDSVSKTKRWYDETPQEAG